MSERSMGPGWWQAADGRWYPPEQWAGPPGSGPPASVPAARPSPWGTPPPVLGSVVPSEPPGVVAPSAGLGSASPPAAVGQGTFRSGRGPRVRGVVLLGLFGLLGLLLTLAILAVLAVRSMDGLSGAGTATGARADGAPVVPDRPAGGADLSPRGAPDAAAGAACQVDRSTVQTAIQAYELTRGSPPPDVAALVSAGLLGAPVDTFVIKVGGGTALLEGAGACVGR